MTLFLNISLRIYRSFNQFDPKIINDNVSTLSGGQKNRLLLAKVLANPKSCLILDEPTNDLDVDTLDLLNDTLNKYKGTLIIVSHDRDFLDQTVTKILAFEGNSNIEWFEGNYQAYEEDRRRRLGSDADQPHRIKYKPIIRA